MIKEGDDQRRKRPQLEKAVALTATEKVFFSNKSCCFVKPSLLLYFAIVLKVYLQQAEFLIHLTNLIVI